MFPSSNTIAQSLWTKTYGGVGSDFARSIIKTYDQGYLIVGVTDSYGAGSYDWWLVKINSQGDTLWTNTYGGSAHDMALSGIETSDEGFLIIGSTTSYGAGSWVIKTNFQGDTLWTRTYGGRSALETSDGGYLFAGSTNGDYRLLKSDYQGDILWTQTYERSSNDYVGSVIETTDGGYLIAGDALSDFYEFFLIKTTSLGDTLWTRTYGGWESEHVGSVIETSDGGYLIAGSTMSYGAGDFDYWLVKINFQGDTLWTRTYGGSNWDWATSVIETPDEGYLIAGETESYGSGRADYWLVKTNFQGDTLWTHAYGGNSSDYGRAVIASGDEQGYLFIGSTRSYGAGGSDIWLVKTDQDGNTVDPVTTKTLASIRPEKATLKIFPNPFNNTCRIQYTQPSNSTVLLTIYDLRGSVVFRMTLDEKMAGPHSEVWDGKSIYGDELDSGVYIVRLSATRWTKSQKVVLMK
jgi:hypothetical protein